MYDLKSIKQEFKEKGIFYTPPELSEYLKTLIDINISDVYDPTCGSGSLLSVFADDLPKFGQEINGHQLEIAQRQLKNFTGVCGDTLKDPAFMDKRFSCIVGNPPFSVQWEPPIGVFADERFAQCPAMPPKSKADYAFLLHIIHLLSDDGIAVVLNFPGILYRGNTEGVIRKWFVDKNYIEKVVQIPGKTFVDTSIATVALVLKKNKTNDSIEFIDSENKLSRIVEIKEIAQNNYNLSVSSYVQKPVERVFQDPIDLQNAARAQMIRKIKADIELDRLVCQIEGIGFDDYLNDLKNIINSLTH